MEVQSRARNRAQTSRQRRAQSRTKRSSSRKLESFIFIAVLAVAIGGFLFLYQGTGQAYKRLPSCAGGYIIPQMSFTGLSANYYADYNFRGIEGTIELVDMKGPGARFSVDGVLTHYLELTDSWIGEKVGIKVGDINRNSVSLCLASTFPECVDYYWDLNTNTKECGQWSSQADRLFSKNLISTAKSSSSPVNDGSSKRLSVNFDRGTQSATLRRAG